MFGRLLLDPQGGEGGNGAAAETKTEAGKGADLSKAAEGLVAKHGDPTAALLVLLGENYSLRDKNREIGARVPKEGAIVLEGDDAKHWSHYRELGKPSELRAALGERDAYKAEAGGFRKAEVTRSAAEIHGFKPSVLGTLARDLEIEIGEEKGKDGKPVRVAFVKGDGDAKTPLNEHAEAHWADFLPSLRGAKAPAPAIGSPPGASGQPRPAIEPAGVRRSLVK